MKIGLRVKFGFFFLMFGCMMLVAVWIMIYMFAGEVFLEHYADSIGKIVDVTAYSLDLTPEDLRLYGESGIPDEHYRDVLKRMNDIREMSKLEYLYIIYPKGTDTAVWLFDASGEGAEQLGNLVENYTSDAFEAVRNIYLTGEKSSNLDSTETDLGSLVSVYYPLKDENGSTIAVLGADKSLYDIMTALVAKMVQISGQMALLIAAGMLVLLLFVQFGVIHSIRRLRQGVQKMADGELGVSIPCRRRDEIGDITAVFNRMSANIKGHIAEVEELNTAYQKFVSPGTFEILQKNSVVEIRLGDQEKTGLTVLSMEPKDFAGMTHDMSSEGTFRYINGILEKTVPAVLNEGGTIERFEKAGLYSLYRNSSEHALRSAILACENLRKNGEKLSAGIAQGPVMVGIAGHSKRMDIISISEQTKIAGFLMEIAEKYHASVLISEMAAKQIPDMETSYHCRFLGYLKITASDRYEGVIDIFDGDEPGERKFKRITKERFEQGVRLFVEKNYQEARRAFIEVLKQYRRDSAAREYLYRCNQYLQEPNEAGELWIEIL